MNTHDIIYKQSQSVNGDRYYPFNTRVSGMGKVPIQWWAACFTSWVSFLRTLGTVATKTFNILKVLPTKLR